MSQTISATHRVREALVRDRTSTTNQMSRFLAGIWHQPAGPAIFKRLPALLSEREAELPPRLIALIERLRDHHKYLFALLTQQLAEDERSQRLLEIPGVGPITASVLAVELGDAHQFANARQFAASIGLVPRQYSTGGKSTLFVSANGATRICDGSWFREHGSSCSVFRSERMPWANGRGACYADATRMSWPVRWLTKWRGSPGLSSPKVPTNPVRQ